MTAHPPGTTAIETTGLGKRFGTLPALEGLDLVVPPGTVFGFLGPNGAGKTTTIRLLLGFIRPSAGSARIFGLDTWSDGVAARRALGYLVPPEALYLDMSGDDQLDYAARLSGTPPVLRDRFLDALELGKAPLRRRLGTFSKGMRQKLALVMACQGDPDLLILDEPTDGLDPLVQRAFESLLRERHRAGRTIFMSSHDLAEVERTCQRVAVVRGGHLVAQDSVAELLRLRRRTVDVRIDDAGAVAILALPNATCLSREDGRLRAAIDGDLNPLLRILALHDIGDLSIESPTLEDAFMAFYEPAAAAPGPNGTAGTAGTSGGKDPVTLVAGRGTRVDVTAGRGDAEVATREAVASAGGRR
ncbi:MAG: ABC transporter ATP-binding protein [Thermomicrobiales bacterium]